MVRDYGGQERRSDELADLRRHVDQRLKAQDEKLDELLAILKASKWSLAAIKWIAAVGASLAAAWFAFKGGAR